MPAPWGPPTYHLSVLPAAFEVGISTPIFPPMTVDSEAEEACHLPEVVSSRPADYKAMVFKMHTVLVKGRGMI